MRAAFQGRSLGRVVQLWRASPQVDQRTGRSGLHDPLLGSVSLFSARTPVSLHTFVVLILAGCHADEKSATALRTAPSAA